MKRGKKRMKKNMLMGSLMLGFLCVGGLTGYLVTDLTGGDYDTLLLDFQELKKDYDALLENYNILSGNNSELEEDYGVLYEDYNYLLSCYNELEVRYNTLLQEWNILATWIKGMILPAQYLVFTEAVRRYYFEEYYLDLAIDTSTYWYEFTRFCRDIVLHDSQIEGSLLAGSWFPEVSNALADCLKYGSQTEELAFDIFYWTFYPWIPNWNGFGLSGNELNDIDTIVDWCIDEIDYEYDTDIIEGQETPYWDYAKFPVETAFRTLGDCEDQAMLCSAYLESCGFETALAMFHDAENPEFEGGFYHATLLVHIEDISNFQFWHPLCPLWNLGDIDPYEGFTWCWLDPTWDVSFTSRPGWMQYYRNNGINDDDLTGAICDLDGAISL